MGTAHSTHIGTHIGGGSPPPSGRSSDILGESPVDAVEGPGSVLWKALDSSAVREPACGPTGAGTVVEYSIDSNDMLIAVDEDWADFARGNDAPELADPDGSRTIWSYIGTDEVRDLWRVLVARVRSSGACAYVPLRCDAPGMRRWFEMTITPGLDGGVHFSSVLVFEEPRSVLALLDPRSVRDTHVPAVSLCSWCAKGHDGSGWRDAEELVRDLRLLEGSVPVVEHGICPRCLHMMSTQLVGSRDSLEDA